MYNPMLYTAIICYLLALGSTTPDTGCYGEWDTCQEDWCLMGNGVSVRKGSNICHEYTCPPMKQIVMEQYGYTPSSFESWNDTMWFCADPTCDYSQGLMTYIDDTWVCKSDTCPGLEWGNTTGSSLLVSFGYYCPSDPSDCRNFQLTWEPPLGTSPGRWYCNDPYTFLDLYSGIIILIAVVFILICFVVLCLRRNLSKKKQELEAHLR